MEKAVSEVEGKIEEIRGFWAAADAERCPSRAERDIAWLLSQLDERGAALRKLPLDAFGTDMEDCDAADFVDHAGDFFEAILAARKALGFKEAPNGEAEWG